MSIRKTFIIDSNNRSRGDESVFEIDIDRNYFNKVPNAIKLINSNILIENEFINDTNNKIRVEKIDNNLKVVDYLDITIQPANNINTADALVNHINERLKDRMSSSQLFGSNYLILNFVKSELVSVSVNAYTDIPYPSISNKTEFPYSYDYFTLIPSSSNFKSLNLAVNFNIDNSIGPLLGFGTRRFVPSAAHLYNLDATVPITNTTVYRFVKPTWYVTGQGFFKSENKLLDYSKINNLNIEGNDKIFINEGGQLIETTYLIDFNTGLNSQLLAEELTNIIKKTTVGANLAALYGFTTTYSNIDVTYVYKQRKLIIAGNNIAFDLNFNDSQVLADNTLSSTFDGIIKNQSSTITLGNNPDGIYTNISGGLSLEFLDPSDVEFPEINSLNNALSLKGSLASTYQKFRAPWNNIIEDVYEQNIASTNSFLGNGITAVTCVYAEDDIMPNTVATGARSTRKITTTLINNKLIVDGFTLQHGDIVLINTKNNKILNGVYVYNNSTEYWFLERIFNYNSFNVNFNPILNDYVYVCNASVYYNNSATLQRKNNIYDNVVFKLTYTNKPSSAASIIFDDHEIYFTPVYFGPSGNTFIPFPVDYISSWDTAFTAGFGGYDLTAPSEIKNNVFGQLYINGMPTFDNQLILVDQTVNPVANGVYKITDTGSTSSVWKLQRYNVSSPSHIIDGTGATLDISNAYIGLEQDYEDDIIAFSNDGLKKDDGPILTIGGIIVVPGDIVLVKAIALNPANKRYAGYYTCIDNGDGSISNNWKLRRIDTINNEFLFDDDVSTFHLFIGLKNNANKKLSAYKINQPPDYTNRKFKDRNQLLTGLVRVINATYETGFPLDLYPNSIANNANPYKRLGDIIKLSEESSGIYRFEYKTDPDFTILGPYNPNTKPIFKLQFGTNNIGFNTTIKQGNFIYESDVIVQTNSISSGSFKIKIPELTSPTPQPIMQTLTVPVKNFTSTTELVDAVNDVFSTLPTGLDRIRLRYDNFNSIYNLYHLDGQLFTADFTIASSIGKTIGFDNSLLTNLSSYNSKTILTIESTTKPNNIYICSDLVDSIDSGSIIPLGGPTPVENVLFSIPNLSSYDDNSNMEVLINNSAFAQKFIENKFINNKIPIKFWLKLPNGVGFKKQPWYMRTELIFKTVGDI